MAELGDPYDVVPQFTHTVRLVLQLHGNDSTLFSMKRELPVRTVSVPLDLDQGQISILRESVDDYNTAWQIISEWCAINRSVDKTRLQKEMYREVRSSVPDLPSQFTSMAIRHSSGTMKTWNKNNPKRRWRDNLRRRKQTLPLDLRTMSLRGNLLTISTRIGHKRIRTMLEIPAWFGDRYPQAKVNAATLHLHHGEQPKINLVFRVGEPAESTGTKTVGIDQGLYNLAVTSEGDKFSGKKVRAANRRYLYNRKTLQQKGTRSAKRRLKAMSGREKRFMRDINHQISKQLAGNQEVSMYVLEDLTGIRGSARSRSKKSRSWLNKWAFGQLDFFIGYKCLSEGKQVEHVDPAHTSQQCNRCGFIDRKNRAKSKFSCVRCGHKDHADLNAALNIKDRYLLSVPEGGAG